MSKIVRQSVLAGVFALAGMSAVQAQQTQALSQCNTGSYTLSDASVLDISAAPAGNWRWRTLDGRFGPVNAADQIPAHPEERNLTIEAQHCDSIRIVSDAGEQQGSRLVFEQIDSQFTGANEQLVGRLVLPRNASKLPVVVMVHGSEATSAVQFNAWQRLLPAMGVGVFVYDKRGTGGSTGNYTQDFQLLAGDASAAVREARRLAGDRLESLTMLGTSQGGWVAPLAASNLVVPNTVQTNVDKLIVAYGLAISPNDEDREQVLLEMQALGYQDSDLAAAAEVATATGVLMASGFREGFAEYARVRKAYKSRPWFSQIQGEYTGDILGYPAPVLRLLAPIARRLGNQGTPWDYDPMPVLNTLGIPQLWVIAGDDTEAPPETTLRRLNGLKTAGKPITILEFPETDHGIVEFVEIDGRRVATRVADGYLRAVAEFAKGNAVKQ